jgi:hypothetical protein
MSGFRAFQGAEATVRGSGVAMGRSAGEGEADAHWRPNREGKYKFANVRLSPNTRLADSKRNEWRIVVRGRTCIRCYDVGMDSHTNARTHPQELLIATQRHPAYHRRLPRTPGL